MEIAATYKSGQVIVRGDIVEAPATQARKRVGMVARIIPETATRNAGKIIVHLFDRPVGMPHNAKVKPADLVLLECSKERSACRGTGVITELDSTGDVVPSVCPRCGGGRSMREEETVDSIAF